ncbi:MAG TPA: c-type cytochrome [Acidimicrobiales bacterium]|nr:c-type cytochrome [Acidimicrobiales bacterium]
MQITLVGAVLLVGIFATGAVGAGASTHAVAPKAPTDKTMPVESDAGATKAAAAKGPQRLSPALGLGETLFDENCSSCHGLDAAGSSLGVSLLGRGAATVDLWVSSGWMPLAVPTAQPSRGPDRFTRAQTIAIADYVASLKPGGFAIPSGAVSGANVSEGQNLFSENCAGCHTITGSGDALSGQLNAPSLHGLTPTMISEAIITAPGNMPRFYPGALTAAQVRDVVAYVAKDIGHPDNVGGIGLGGDGPVAEGFIGLFIGVGACLLFALWVGDRSEDEESTDDALKEAHV